MSHDTGHSVKRCGTRLRTIADSVGLLNRRLAELLAEQGQQSDLARQLGEKRQRVNNWVRNKADVPADEVPRIAALLGVTICELYGVEEGHSLPATITLADQVIKLLGVDADRVEVNVYVSGEAGSGKSAATLPGARATRRLIDEYRDLPEDQRQEWRELAEAIRAEEEGGGA